MKKLIGLMLGAALLAGSLSANAWWGGNRGWGGDYYNDWPVWTPMYWMEEMSDSWDDDYWDGPYGYGGPYGGYGPYGGGYGPYGYGAPYGGGYGAPYGGGYGAPYGGGYGAPYGGYYGAPAYPTYPEAPATTE